MATVKVKFRASTVAGREGTLYYQIIHDRHVYRLRTGYRLYPSEWDAWSGRCSLQGCSDFGRMDYLSDLQQRILADTERLRHIILTLDHSGENYSFEQISSAYAFSGNSRLLFGFMEELIERFREQDRIRTSETYATALQSFSRFRHFRDIRLDAIDSDLMAAYEANLRMSGVSKNTSSFYMRILRAVYNRAVEKQLTPQRMPFKHVYTGIDKTVKRAIPLESIRRLRRLDLTLSPLLDYARDMFLLSFYLRGMSFVDMTYLKRSDLQNGVLTYRRKKTGQQLRILWEPCMQEIVDKYPERHGIYLLPILREGGRSERRQYKNVGCLINRNLKRLGQELELSIPLTLYVARHTWASIAKSQNIPLSVISESMGHDSEATTRIYLASLDTAVVDHANRLVINSVSDDYIL